MTTISNKKTAAKYLKELKRLNGEISDIVSETGKGEVDPEAGFDKIAALIKEFDKVKSDLPDVKMDMETGEYFPAKDETDREIFRVRVVRTSVVDVYDVPACNAEVAMSKALRLKDVSPVRWCLTPAKAEVISAPEE